MANLGGGDVITALVTLPAGAIAIGILLVDEVDEAFANVYSTTMSVQNLLPRLDRRIVAVTIGVVATLLAGLLDFGQYQSFLFLIGSVFVPLFAVAAVDFFAVSGQRWDVSDRARLRVAPVIAWACGFVAYQLVYPGTRGGLGEPLGRDQRRHRVHRPQLARLLGRRHRGRRPGDADPRPAHPPPHCALSRMSSPEPVEGCRLALCR